MKTIIFTEAVYNKIRIIQDRPSWLIDEQKFNPIVLKLEMIK